MQRRDKLATTLTEKFIMKFGSNNNNANILDKKNLIRSRLIEVFNCPNISSIGFISNKTENYTSTYPVNFYAFCISIKILLLCFPKQIKNFHIGIFNSEQTSFNINTNNYFLSELFCSYVSFLYLSSKKLPFFSLFVKKCKVEF